MHRERGERGGAAATAARAQRVFARTTRSIATHRSCCGSPTVSESSEPAPRACRPNTTKNIIVLTMNACGRCTGIPK